MNEIRSQWSGKPTRRTYWAMTLRLRKGHTFSAGPKGEIEVRITPLSVSSAKFTDTADGELEQIQFLLGCVSIHTTKRYSLGCKHASGPPSMIVSGSSRRRSGSLLPNCRQFRRDRLNCDRLLLASGNPNGTSYSDLETFRTCPNPDLSRMENSSLTPQNRSGEGHYVQLIGSGWPLHLISGHCDGRTRAARLGREIGHGCTVGIR